MADRADSNPSSPKNDLVGMLDHVFKKTFKEYFAPPNSHSERESNQSPVSNQSTGEDADSPDIAKEDDPKDGVDPSCSPSDGASSGEVLEETAQGDGGNAEEKLDESEFASKSESECGSLLRGNDEDSVDRPETEVEADEGEAFALVYENQVAQVSKKLENEIKVASELDQYLIETKRLAKKADERRAEELYSQGLLLKTEYPVNRSHLEIDKAKLDEYDPFSKDLVLPEDLMAVNEKREMYICGRAAGKDQDAAFSKQLRPSTPNYLQGVIKKDRSADESGSAKSGEAITKVVQPAAMSMEKQHANQTKLDRLQSKLQFLKNPRFKKGGTDASGSSLANGGITLRAIPDVVRFSKYRAAEMQRTVVQIQNLLGVSQFLRILPPASKHFAIGTPVYPTQSGMLAPGMSCSVPIMFVADSLGDYEDKLNIQTDTGELEVKLVAEREKPILSLPEVFQVGPCLKGETSSIVLRCINTGGDGSFVFVNDTGEADVFNPTLLKPFSIHPVRFDLAKGQSVDIEVTLNATEEGCVQRSLGLVSNMCTRNDFTLTGQCHLLDLKMTSLDGFDYTPPQCRIPKSVGFKSTTIHAVQEKAMEITNAMPIAVDYEWRITAGQYSPKHSCETDSTPYRIHPSNGTLEAGSSGAFIVQFNPTTLGLFEAEMCLLAKGVPGEALQGGEAKGIIDAEVLRFRVEGESTRSKLEVQPGLLSFDKRLVVDKAYEVSFNLHNPSGNDLTFQVDACQDATVDVEIQGQTCIASGENVDVPFTITFHSAGEHEVRLPLTDVSAVVSAPLAMLRIHASVDCPLVEFKQPIVNFGLLAVNTQREEKLELVNPGATTARVCLSSGEAEASASEATGAEISFDVERLEIAPGMKGSSIERLRRVVICEVDKGYKTYLSICGEIQAPRVYVTSPQLAQGVFQLGTTYVSVSVEKQLELVNLSNLPAHFAFVAVSTGGKNDKFELSFSEANGTIEPKGRKTVGVVFTPRVAGRVCSFYECKVEGMKETIGFGLETVSKGLEVETTVVGQEASNASGPATVDFGSEIPLYQRKKLQVKLENKSAIPTRFYLSFKRFGGVDPPQSLLDNKPTGFLLKPSYSALKSYSSEEGRAYMEEKLSMEEDRKCLKEGVALLALPNEGELEAWSSVTVDIVCLNNMPGVYKSALVCEINGLEPRQLPIKMAIKGSPLKIATTTLGLSSIHGESDGGRYALDLGSVMVGGGFQDRRVRVVNNGPFSALVTWSLMKERQEAIDPVIVQLNADMADSNDVVAVEIETNPELSAPPPFQVIPEEQLVRGHSSCEFSFRYLSNETAVCMDKALARADATFQPGNDGDASNIASMLSTSSSKPKTMCVSKSQASSGSRVSLRSSAKSIAMGSSMSDSVSSFAKFDRLRGWVKLELAAHSFAPVLYCDLPQLADGFAHVDFFIQVGSCSGLERRKCEGRMQQITFQNRLPTQLTVKLATSQGFRIAAVEHSECCVNVSKDGKGKHVLDAVKVVPGGVVTLRLEFVGKLSKKTRPAGVEEDINNELEATVDGELEVEFENGNKQVVRLTAMIERAALEVYPANLDFGFTHVERMRKLSLRLRSFTRVALRWRVECIASTSPAGDDEAARSECLPVWTFEPSEGVIDRHKIPVRLDNSLTPVALAPAILPDLVDVVFRPRIRGKYRARFRFIVEHGVDFEITLQGEGSYDEIHDDSTKRLPAPQGF